MALSFLLLDRLTHQVAAVEQLLQLFNLLADGQQQRRRGVDQLRFTQPVGGSNGLGALARQAGLQSAELGLQLNGCRDRRRELQE